MTKKDSIFKTIAGYFNQHPLGILAWLWISFMPFIGSMIFIWNYQILEGVYLDNLVNLLGYLGITALLMGFAFLPTTMIASISGFFFGWVALPFLILSYTLATLLGYRMGQKANSFLLESLYSKHPHLKEELDARKSKEMNLIFFVRISPIIPFSVSNFIFASMKIPLKKVLIFGVLGMLPRSVLVFGTGVLANSFIAASKSLSSPVQWGIGFLLLVIGLIGLYQYIRKKPESA
jgi:uncharacterized membrane protein YdjX (TVP38/TMEM64 family)